MKKRSDKTVHTSPQKTINPHYYAHSLKGRPRKEWQRLEEHLENVARLARQFAEPFGGGDWAEL